MIRRNIFSILVGLLLMYLSLTNAEEFQRLPLSGIPYIDKIVHFVMYFIMMSVLITEHWKTIRNIRQIFLLAVIPMSYGILMEILQATVTSTRSGSFFDALFDCLGILASILLWVTIKYLLRQNIR